LKIGNIVLLLTKLWRDALYQIKERNVATSPPSIYMNNKINNDEKCDVFYSELKGSREYKLNTLKNYNV